MPNGISIFTERGWKEFCVPTFYGLQNNCIKLTCENLSEVFFRSYGRRLEDDKDNRIEVLYGMRHLPLTFNQQNTRNGLTLHVGRNYIRIITVDKAYLFGPFWEWPENLRLLPQVPQMFYQYLGRKVKIILK